MIELYFWPTPNCYKVSILLEELEMPYTVKPVHIGKGRQFEADFLTLNPNGKVPAIVDPDGPGGERLAVFESGTIMVYLAEKTSRFLPQTGAARYDVMQWLMFQMGGVGPMLGQAHHFRRYAPETISYAVERYTREAARLYGVLDRRLGERDFLAGDYSIADMAVYPWLRPYKWQGQKLSDFQNVQRWYSAVRARPAVQRGLAVMKDRLERNRKTPEGEAWNVLFGGGTDGKPVLPG